MPGDTSQSYIISKYLKCNPKEFSTWVYVAIILIPYYTPHPLSHFLQILFNPISELYSQLLNTSVVGPILNYILRLMSSPTSTPSGISHTYSRCTLLNPFWKPLSISLIFIQSSFLSLNTQPSVITYSSTIIPIHIPTHFLIYIPEPITSTKGSICHFSLVSPLNLPFKMTMMWYWFILGLVSSQRVPQKKHDKNGHLFGFVLHAYFFFWTVL